MDNSEMFRQLWGKKHYMWSRGSWSNWTQDPHTVYTEVSVEHKTSQHLKETEVAKTGPTIFLGVVPAGIL